MKNRFLEILSVIVIISTIGLVACEKYQDPDPAEDDERLTNPYCNDPRAVNYNQGFPGKPDNSVCIFPIDLFQGDWTFTDTVYAADESMLFTETVNLKITTVQDDETVAKLQVSGWCGNEVLQLTANKVKEAYGDTLDNGLEEGWQVICSQQDTFSYIKFSYDLFDSTFIKIDMSVRNANGLRHHRGTAVK